MPHPPADRDPLPFTAAERAADGCLIVLVPALLVPVLTLAWRPGGAADAWGLLLAELAGILAFSVALGCLIARGWGRRYVGGMFLPRWLRALYVAVLLALVVAGLRLAVVRPGPEPPAAAGPAREKS